MAKVGVFLSIMQPQGTETHQDVAIQVSQKHDWRADPEDAGHKVHRGTHWAVVVKDFDNPKQRYVIALAQDPSEEDFNYMHLRSAGQTIYEVTDVYKEGNKVRLGHNGPL